MVYFYRQHGFEPIEQQEDMMPLVLDDTGNDLTYRIIGAAMAVHNEIGPGFKEEVYEKALQIKLNQVGVGFFIWISSWKIRLLWNSRLSVIN